MQYYGLNILNQDQATIQNTKNEVLVIIKHEATKGISLFEQGSILEAAELGRLPFHDIEDADWQVAQGKNKEDHHQHASCLTPGSDLFDLSTNSAGSDPHGLSLPRSGSWALHGPPLPLQHWCASRNLLIKYVHASGQRNIMYY